MERLGVAPHGKKLALSSAAAAVVLVGCPGGGTSPPTLEASAETLDFGTVSVGLDEVQTFTLTNTGSGVIDLFSLTLTEGSEAVWAVTRDPGDTLEAGASLTVSVLFVPDAETQRLGRIQVRSSDDANPSLFVSLRGVGGPSVADDDGDGYSAADGDCNDDNDAMFPGNPEVCDGLDNDCDGSLLADETDEDNDGFALCDGDCNDDNGDVYPGAPEICDGLDSDCDGVNADSADNDNDTFTPCQGDCDDDEPTAFPGNPEVCDGLDNDCSEVIDDLDVDGDGHSPCSTGGDCDDEDPLAFPVVVDPDAAAGGDGSDEAPFQDIGTALNNLDDECRTIALVADHHDFSGTVDGIEVTIVGQSRTSTVIDPDGGRFFDVINNGSLTLSGMTISGFVGTADGGAISVTNASLSLIDVHFEGNETSGDGGAVAVFTGELSIQDTTFLLNTAGDDGGAIALVSSTITDGGGNHFALNSAVRGGAIVADGSLVQLDGSSFHENEATDDGGALMLVGLPAMEIGRLEVFDNTAGLTGGGIAVNNTTDTDGWIRNCAVRNNVAGASGGGLYVGGNVAGFVIANNTLTENGATEEGGGIHVDADDASSLFVASNIVAYSSGDSGFEARVGVGGTYMANTAFGTGAVNADFVGELSAGSDDNTVVNPQLATFTPDGDPFNDVVGLGANSPMIDTGLHEDDAPTSYPDWDDLDGTQNDRGASGGPGA